MGLVATDGLLGAAVALGLGAMLGEVSGSCASRGKARVEAASRIIARVIARRFWMSERVFMPGDFFHALRGVKLRRVRRSATRVQATLQQTSTS